MSARLRSRFTARNNALRAPPARGVAAEPASEDTDPSVSGIPQLVRIVGSIVAPTTLLTALLSLTGSLANELLVGYPFLIAASGLWFQIHLVWFTTIACEAAYATLILGTPWFPVLYLAHYHISFMVALLVEGFVIAYQVQRIRVLNRYYENRPLP